MKSIRFPALKAALFFTVLYIVFSTSCTNKCKNVTCYNGGYCSVGKCTCPTGLLGNQCQTLECIGSWSGTDTFISLNAGGASGIVTYNVSVTPSSPGSKNMIITGIRGLGNDTITGLLNAGGNVITFTNQILNPNTPLADTLNGALTVIDSAQYTDNYTAYDTSGRFSYNGTFTKQ